MLPAHIIALILEREREARRREEQRPQPFLELPQGPMAPPREHPEAEENRGVVVIEL